MWVSALPVVYGQTHADEAKLSRVADVRRLTHEQAAASIPVHLVGVVTDLSGYKNSFFFQDGTAGISVDRTDSAEAHVGDRVEIEGVSNAGLFAPIVLATTVHVLGQAAQPRPVVVTYADLLGGAQDSQRVELRGVVHAAKAASLFGRRVLSLDLDAGGASVQLLVQDAEGLDGSRFADATVRVRGVCATEFNEKRQFTGVSLLVPFRSDIDIVQPAAKDPFAVETVPVRNTFQFGHGMHRVKVAGVVTWQLPGHVFYLQDGEDGIRIETSMDDVLELGTQIEAVGFPAMGKYAPILADALFRVTGPPVSSAPAPVTPADILSRGLPFNKARHDGQLVQIQGTVIESRVEGTQRIYTLRQVSSLFEAHLMLPGPERAKGLPIGSVVLLTGICTIVADADGTPASFELLLRSSKDITVLRKAPWWTPAHLMLLLASLAGTILLGVLWVAALRKQVEQQTRTIRESEERFRDLAQRDVLTGLPNRLLLDEHMQESLVRCRESRRQAAVFTVDIDRFKFINDTYGHPVGDECLKLVASRLRHSLPKGGIIARTGGEEFTLLAEDLGSPAEADRLAHSILDLFGDPLLVGDVELAVTVSIGGALYPDHGAVTEELRKRSDEALYEAKRTGRNRVVFVTEELQGRLGRITAIEQAVRDSLRTRSFHLAYQPIYDAAGEVCRLEALLRTTNERLQRLAPRGPATWVPIAEANGMILPLGRWVLQETCRQVASWRDAGLRVCPVAVNLSASQLLQSGFVEDVLQVLDSFDLHPSALEFELTEMAATADFEAVAERVNRLAAAGLTFAIDDFGTGSSSLTKLQELPLTFIKIDGSFVRGMENDRDAYAIVQAMIYLTHSLKLQVVAEGVESRRQFDLLRELGCCYFQGNLLGAPMPGISASTVLAEKHPRLLTAVS